MIFSRVLIYSCLFLVLIPLVKSRCSCCGGNNHNIRTCISKDNCPLNSQNLIKSKKYTCGCCGDNGHNIRSCRFKDNCPLHDQKEFKEYSEEHTSNECYFTIERKIFVKKGEKIKQSCKCAREGDEQCHGIADMLGGLGKCSNCMSCSHIMNNKMKKMENFVKKSDGGVYIVACDNKKYAKTITQIFSPYKGNPTTTIITRESPTNHSDL
ncbi:hypothetical protein RclHR1_03000015 [Rhizophagus clarus]|uniref:CCHC-type domain-containing protein n=1 Tax=Rhizophagus clarus TaxID=94130 RepID=A0A2Z6R995_9GLOM|nr:hypothetical protein RclHR1_03000015 [Rhizophagus clarus]GES84781.1 hypothetical protein RCL_jg24129.t1 [Rhizophagus clarus]